MSEKRFRANFDVSIYDSEKEEYISASGRGLEEIAKRMNEQQATISQLEEEKDYWKSKAMTLLMQVRRLTPRMTDKEVKEFSKELEDG